MFESLPLAAPADGASAVIRSVFWVLLTIVVTVVLVLLALAVKKRFSAAGDVGPSPVGGGFTVGDLRRMRDNGEISDEEFERARERIVAGAKRRLAEEAERAGNPDRPPPEAPLTKDTDLIRDAEG